MMKPLTVLITGAGGPLGANVARSLRRTAEDLVLWGTDANSWHLPLSLCDRTVKIPPASDRARYATSLERLVAEGAAVILPTHPVEVRAVAGLRADGRIQGVGLALPSVDVLDLAGDKFATWTRLDGAGVPVPRSILLGRPEDLERAFDQLTPPIWVRGTGAPGLGIGGAALACRDISVARAWIEHHRGWGGMMAAELLPGANLTWMCAMNRGRLVAAATRERLEYVLPHVSPSGITGAPAVSRTLRRNDVERTGESAVRAIDPEPHGVYFVDLKEDTNGTPRVTEINAGRCGTTVHFYTEAGCNFPYLLVCLAADRPLEGLPRDPNDAVAAGQYWVRTLDCGPVLVPSENAFQQYEELP